MCLGKLVAWQLFVSFLPNMEFGRKLKFLSLFMSGFLVVIALRKPVAAMIIPRPIPFLVLRFVYSTWKAEERQNRTGKPRSVPRIHACDVRWA